MYGKYFASAFTGSMVGAGANVFAVWGYVIANTKPDGHVELNPQIIAATIGCKLKEVNDAIEYLKSADPHSRSKKHEGRRLIQVAAFLYQVPTYLDYRGIRDGDDRRKYMREYMREYRAKDDVNVNVNQGKPRLAHTEAEAEVEADKNITPPNPPKGGTGLWGFDKFWKAYPRKVGKRYAESIWKRRKLGAEIDLILDDLSDRVERDEKWKKGFIPNPSTYLNQDRWRDAI